MANNIDLKINEHFIPFFKTRKRYAISYGGAGSGKSVSIAQKIITRCLGEAKGGNTHRILCVRKVKSSIKESVFKLLRDQISDLELSTYVKVNQTDMSIRFNNGAEIITSGLDDVEKLKSITNITSIWIEEATELDEGDLTQLDLRLRGISPYYKQIMISFNPISETHWLKKVFFDRKSNDVFIIHSTFEHNGFLDAPYKKMLRERYIYDENMYRIYVKGKFGRIVTGQEFYSAFKYSRHVIKSNLLFRGSAYHLSFDFNVNPYMPATLWQIQRNEKGIYNVFCIDEFALKNPRNMTEYVCDEFIKKYGKGLKRGDLFIYGDASGRSRRTANNFHDYDVIESTLKDYLNNTSIRVPKSNPPVRQRRVFVNKILKGGYNIDMTISDKCKLLITDFESVIEDADGKKKKQIARDKITKVAYEKYGHLSDSADYFLCSAFESYFDDLLLNGY